MTNFTASLVEDAALAWLESLGYTVKHGPEIAPGELAAERNLVGIYDELGWRWKRHLYPFYGSRRADRGVKQFFALLGVY